MLTWHSTPQPFSVGIFYCLRFPVFGKIYKNLETLSYGIKERVMKKTLCFLAVMVCLLFTPVGFTASLSDEEYIKDLETRALNGDVEAQSRLGYIYENGLYSVKQDYAKAAEWYEKAAKQGHMLAQANLSNIYYAGRGVKQDYAKAFEWVEKAAKQGDAISQYNLGIMYDQGQGVRQDYVKAREWYEKAAAQGDVNAQFNLGIMYATGEGVEQDYVKAKEWFGKACDNGLNDGCDAYKDLNLKGCR